MRFSSFIKQPLVEAVKLTPSELEKQNSRTKEDRIDILTRLIKDKTPLELAKEDLSRLEK